MLIYLLVVILIYLFISEIYMKRKLGIKSQNRWIFHEERYKVSIAIDVLLLIIFIFLTFEFLLERPHYSTIVKLSPSFIMMFLTSINRGIEEYLQDRSSKTYYHDWLAAFMMVLTFGIMYFGEEGYF
ncbi:DUF4181 domain-containing protein [Guptibacillus algicola]|uniref:DUF4181 domain-containing protein n=1 Tax=Guptibacillus algicola TaxID=225844 RepID=UPI001CD31D7D|nr:DUF4181 domain-containing protein [Alkalihalobacillus algicola]MCA0987346.1 DUF4181 domain-containing protein [Alkalihalobacillus algicola]